MTSALLGPTPLFTPPVKRNKNLAILSDRERQGEV